MARYCLTGSYIALTFPRASPPVTNAALSTAFQADQHLSTDWSDMTTPTSRYCLPAGHLLLLSTLLRFQRAKRKSWVKWQPAFRLVKVVFVVVNRQHRVQNQTVVPVVSVVVKTKAQNILLLSTLLRFQRDNYLHEITQGVATLYPGLCAGCPFGALLLIIAHQTVHP